MKKSRRGADNSFGPRLGERPVWDTNGPDHGECDCPGPPPRFDLPPPPRPYSLSESECFSSETCKALPVIDSEYRYSPGLATVTIILIAGVAVAIFLFIGTFLVLLKKRKTRCKASLRSRCDRTSANGVVYEDLTTTQRGERLSPLGQTRLPPSIEMIDVGPYTDHPALSPPPPPIIDSYDSQDLYNPVYEELSNGSGDQPESNSEGLVRTALSEDEFAEDELSLGGDGEERWRRSARHCMRGAGADDGRSRFLDSLPRNRRPRTLDRRKTWRNRSECPGAECPELSQGFFLRKILQMYPDVTGVTFQYPCGTSGTPPPDGPDYESLSWEPRRHKPDIFSTFETMKSSRDSAPGSDSGYSNNTSGGRPLPVGRREYADDGGVVLS